MFSGWIATCSLASIAWCRPSDRRRPFIMRPVNSSISMTSLSRTMYCWSFWNSLCARSACVTWWTSVVLSGS